MNIKENLELKKILPITTSDAGGEIGIGVGEKNNSKIYYWHREHGEEIKLISNSFTKYISAYYLKKSTLNE